MTATVAPPQASDEITAKRAELVARARALGWSQNELARRIGRNPGTLSRVFAGKFQSAPAWESAERVILRAERKRSRRRDAAR